MAYFSIGKTPIVDPVQASPAASKRTSAESGNFAELLAMAMASGRLPMDQTLADYKKEIQERVSEIDVHPSQYKTGYAVFITEAGYIRMQNDQAYEQYVLDTIRSYMNKPYASSDDAPTYVLLHFGAAEDEHSAAAVGAEQEYAYDKALDEGFWEARARRHEENMEARARLAEKRRVENDYFLRQELVRDAVNEALMARADARRRGEPYADSLNPYLAGVPAELVMEFIVNA